MAKNLCELKSKFYPTIFYCQTYENWSDKLNSEKELFSMEQPYWALLKLAR